MGANSRVKYLKKVTPSAKQTKKGNFTSNVTGGATQGDPGVNFYSSFNGQKMLH